MSALPLDRWPLEREQLRTFDFPLAWGAFVRFDTEVAHPRSEPTWQTMAASRLLGSPSPDFTLQPKMSLAVP